MTKKAQSLSLNAIIIAILALLVLVILAMIFTGKIAWFRVSSEMCDTQGGSCVEECKGDFTKQISYSCDNDGDGNLNEGKNVDGVCCIST